MSIEPTHEAAPVTDEGVLAARSVARFCKSLEVALGEIGLSLPQYRLLAFLTGGPERATALAGWLDVSPPSLTALVDGLVSRGLVERVPSEQDRRSVRHLITDKGYGVINDADAMLAAGMTELASYLPAAQGKKMLEGLGYLAKAMDAARAARTAQEAAAKATAGSAR